MGRGANAHALGNGVGDVKRLADRLGQQVAHNARQDDDGTGQGRNAAQLCSYIHADGGGHGFGQQGGVLLLGQVQRQCQCQRDGQRHGGGQQQVVHRGGADLVIGIGDAAYRQENDHKDRAQQQRVKKCLSGHSVHKGSQCKGGQCQQHTPGNRARKELIQQFHHWQQPPCSFCGWSEPGWSFRRSP